MMNAALLLAVLFLQPPQNAQPPNPAPAADAETAPTVADVRKALENNDGTEALRLVSQLLSLRGKAAQGLDRYELFMLKAEGHLCQRAGDAAAQSFKQAAEQTNNREQAAMARASEQLIRRSRRLAYTPKRVVKGQVAKRDPIDIVDPEKRKTALQALLVDEMAELAPKLQAAKGSRSLVPALKAMQSARDLATLELAANGSADQVNGLVEDLKQSCKELLTRTMEKSTKRIDQVTQMANDPELVRQVFPNPYGGFEVEVAERRRGLKRQDIGELKALADTCDQVAAGGKAVAKAAGVEESEFEELIEAAEDLRMHIRRMLRAHDVEY